MINNLSLSYRSILQGIKKMISKSVEVYPRLLANTLMPSVLCGPRILRLL